MGAAMGDEAAEGVHPIQRRVGAAIASARASVRLSQERLAAEAGLGQPVISRIEAGRRRVGVDELASSSPASIPRAEAIRSHRSRIPTSAPPGPPGIGRRITIASGRRSSVAAKTSRIGAAPMRCSRPA